MMKIVRLDRTQHPQPNPSFSKMWLATLLVALGSAAAFGQSTSGIDSAVEATSDEAAQAERFQAFSEMLSNTVLVGHFSIDGQGSEFREERYEIKSVSKMPAGNLWLINARIRYGDHDVTVPLPVPIEWAGGTPMVALRDFTIPGLGTFDAHVLFEEGRYAGTWQHGDVGGHLFGRIEKSETEASDAEETESDTAP